MNTMFASYLAPSLNLSPRRPATGDDATVATHSTAGSKSSLGSKAKAQDYQVLLKELQQHHSHFQAARSALAASLLRMGEYHVRHGEYDEAASAFTDSLAENRTVVCASFSSLPSIEISETCEESFISSMTGSQVSSGLGTPRNGSGLASVASSSSPYLASVAASHKDSTATPDQQTVEVQRKSFDDMIATLSNLGKVHSLRGEDAVAMQYYDEKTKVQALRSNIEEQLSSSASCMGPAGVFFKEGPKTLLSEINEDVKALDELFRGIGFGKKSESEEDTRNEQESRASDGADERSALSGSTTNSHKSKKGNNDTHRRRRAKVTIDTEAQSTPALPPLRQTRRQSATDPSLREDHELADALDAYRAAIDSYSGRNADKHEKKYANYIRKYEQLRAATSSEPVADNSPSARHREARRKEWQLALSVYEASLAARKEAAAQPFPPGTPRKRSAADFDQDARPCVASTLIAMGGLHYKLRNVDQELEKYVEALEVYRETLGPDHPHVAGTMKNIGTVLAEQGRLDEAMERFQEAKRIYESARGDGGPCCDVASALSCMGNVQNRRGDLEDALRLYGAALNIYRAASKGGRSRLALQEAASTLKIMGMVHTKRGELDLAMGCFQDAIDIMRRNFGERGSGPAVTSILSRIGGIFSKMGRMEEAMSHYQEAYDLATRTYGTADHPEVAQVLHHIGGVHQRQGHLDEAMRCYMNAAKIYQAALGRDDPTVATTLVCIGSLHYIEKKLDGAMEYYQEALRINRATFGTQHPDVIPTMKSIALIHAKREEYDEAIAVFSEVLDVKTGEVGPLHPEVASAHKRIGNVHYQRGDLAGAEDEYQKALAIYQQCLGDDHQATRAAKLVVEKVGQEAAERQGSLEQPQSSSSSFFKRAPKGYESL
ncbi:hypothetical protein ACHAXT_007192 [Thalassiosira profunda]